MIAPPGSRPRATARASVNTSQRIFSPRLLVWLAHIIAVRSQPWQPLDKVLEQWAPLAGVPGKANTHERAYEHMLHLRKLQKPGSRFGHIGWHPIQSFKYYWFARQRAVAAAVQGQTPPTTCEIGFGDAGMSAAIFLTATSSPASAELGGDHHVFDCPACGTESGDDGAWLVASKRRASSYLLSVFGSSRLHQYNGLSHQLIPQVAREQPGLSCDVISIDGDHSYEGVAKDIAAVANSTLWNQDTIVLFDDVLWGVAKAINNSIARKILTIKERFGGDYHLDETFSSQAATPYYDGVPSSEYPRTWHKVFVEARFSTAALDMQRLLPRRPRAHSQQRNAKAAGQESSVGAVMGIIIISVGLVACAILEAEPIKMLCGRLSKSSLAPI